MEIQASRLHARTGPDGAFVPLTEQDRALWDQLLIHRGLDALARAEKTRRRGRLGPLCAASRARRLSRPRPRARAADTDWSRIAALYDRLRVVMPSPVVDLNRAIAHSMAFGPQAGLQRIDEIDAATLPNYAPLPAARGDFLFRAGRLAEARAEFRARRAHPATRGKKHSSSHARDACEPNQPRRNASRSALTWPLWVVVMACGPFG